MATASQNRTARQNLCCRRTCLPQQCELADIRRPNSTESPASDGSAHAAVGSPVHLGHLASHDINLEAPATDRRRRAFPPDDAMTRWQHDLEAPLAVCREGLHRGIAGFDHNRVLRTGATLGPSSFMIGPGRTGETTIVPSMPLVVGGGVSAMAAIEQRAISADPTAPTIERYAPAMSSISPAS